MWRMVLCSNYFAGNCMHCCMVIAYTFLNYFIPNEPNTVIYSSMILKVGGCNSQGNPIKVWLSFLHDL